MINIRKSDDRGIYDFGWLKTSYSFSFAKYYDPNWIGFRNLRVINEDFIQPDNGFGKHYHDNMEIITYIMEGELQHQDSMGNKYKIEKGDVQVMTAGKGVMHSETNPSLDTSVHLLQIWITPDERQLPADYKQKNFLDSSEISTLIASKSGSNDSLKINQDVNLYLIRLKKDQFLDFEINEERYFWLQVTKGNLKINDNEVNAGDGIYGDKENLLKIVANEDAELLLFDLN